jgi:hypothetical protein
MRGLLANFARTPLLAVVLLFVAAAPADAGTYTVG